MANQAWQITSPGKIALNDIGPVPQPGAHQALVRLHAVAVNPRDLLVIAHDPTYPLKHKDNLIPGIDGAGVVEESGPGSIWKKGDRVVIHPSSWKTGNNDRDFAIDGLMGGGQLDGAFRRWMVAADDGLFRAPSGMSLEEACTIYTTGLTAYRALFYAGKALQPGMSVLTQGTGGVSCWTIMIATAAGARVVATSSDDKKLEKARKLGASALINYREHPDLASEVLKCTEGRGVDIAIDVVGTQSIEQTLKCTTYGGLVCVLGMLGQNPAQPVNVMPDIFFQAKGIKGQLGAGSRELAEEFVAFLERHDLHPPIAASFDFEEGDKAVEAMTSLPGVGKVIIRC